MDSHISISGLTITAKSEVSTYISDTRHHISASGRDSNAVPTANPPFSESSNPMALLRIVLDVSGSRFYKMAAYKPEVHKTQLLDKIAAPFQRLTPIFSGSSNPMALLRPVPDVTGSRFFKMTAYKPEVLISQLLNKIATPFQTATPTFFRGPATQCHYYE